MNIKVRIWDSHKKCFLLREKYFIYGLSLDGELIKCHASGDEAGFDYYDNPNIEIMQCTGLESLNGKGKEIYRLDILSNSRKTANFIVDWDDRKAMFNGFYLNGDGTWDDAYEGNLSMLQDLEVIGNFFENPELLKDSDD
jgi:hypothetical protein